jgi:2-methylcitrate dehydratase PrpD
MMSNTAAAAQFIATARDLSIDPAARAAAQRALLDTVAVTLAGTREPAVCAVREVLIQPDRYGDAALFGTAGRASALDAALVNGTAAHALDYDDTHASVRGHPSAPIVAAILAVGESVHASGADVVTAYLVGLEIAGKLGRSLGPAHARQGFHSTSTLGVMGAAAACSSLLKLTDDQCANALGLGASSASGLRASFGTMTKPLHAGNAARAGVAAALLARKGFNSAPDILDSPGGFSEVFSPGDANPAAISGFGQPWEALDPGIAVKKYPCCNRGHRAADAILAILAVRAAAPDDIERVEVHMPAGEVDELQRVGPMTYPRPISGLQAKFSMQYVMASAILDGSLRSANFTDEQVLRPAIQEFLPRVQPISDCDRDPGTAAANYVEVRIVCGDGKEFAERVYFSRGDPRGGSPISWDEIAAKYRDCASSALDEGRIERSLEAFARIESTRDIGDLIANLSTDPLL